MHGSHRHRKVVLPLVDAAMVVENAVVPPEMYAGIVNVARGTIRSSGFNVLPPSASMIVKLTVAVSEAHTAGYAEFHVGVLLSGADVRKSVPGPTTPESAVT